ncbi:MAG: ribosomal protein S18-alanine N-acetyltransferase [Desulfonauticus sp.]|nr:ribosomal protein S18-alanine N-acetyltransferase [Desulfonauticus sp.]
MRLVFKQLCKENLDQVYALERTCFATPWSKEQFEICLANQHVYFWGVFLGRELVAYLSLFCAGKEAEIWNIAVLPEYRQKGIGSYLLAKGLHFLQQKKIKKVFLEVRAGNIAAQRLYFKFHFQQVGCRRHYYPDTKEDAWILAKCL